MSDPILHARAIASGSASEGGPFRKQRRAGAAALRPWLFAGVAALFWVSAGVSSAATFTLNDGESLEGEIIHATRNTLMVKEAVEVRNGKPVLLTNCATGEGVEQVMDQLVHDVLFA